MMLFKKRLKSFKISPIFLNNIIYAKKSFGDGCLSFNFCNITADYEGGEGERLVSLMR